MAGSCTRMAPRIRKLNARIHSSGQTSPERGCAGMAPGSMLRLVAPARWGPLSSSAKAQECKMVRLPKYATHPRNRTAWRQRLQENHAQADTVGFLSYSTRPFPGRSSAASRSGSSLPGSPRPASTESVKRPALPKGNFAPLSGGPSVPSNPSLNRTGRARLSSLAGVTGSGPVGVIRWTARRSSANRDCSKQA
jgi:hypothetical protein